MKERPILFSAPMVRAILDGRKTQTRRIVKPQPVQHPSPPCNPDYDIEWRGFILWLSKGEAAKCMPEYCPYGQPGDRLWVRETFYGIRDGGDGNPCVAYRVDCPPCFAPKDAKWKPSIFMPRWASRITLEITAVRVERLQAITEADAKAEGVKAWQSEGYRVAHNIFDGTKLAYAELWNEINGPGSWAANPWVWVIQFRRVTP